LSSSEVSIPITCEGNTVSGAANVSEKEFAVFAFSQKLIVYVTPGVVVKPRLLKRMRGARHEDVKWARAVRCRSAVDRRCGVVVQRCRLAGGM
jgi:hypothetical protein